MMDKIYKLIDECKTLIEQTEPYQRKMKAKHSRLKKRVVGYGKQTNTPPYTEKPSMERSKSAPPIGEIRFRDFNVKNKWITIDPELLKLNKKEEFEEKNINDEFFDMIDKSYAYIGGHVDFKKPSDIPSNHTGWVAVDVDTDEEPDALRVYKIDEFGNKKLTAGASDGTPEGKRAYLEYTAGLLRSPNTYAEMSDAIAHIMITRYNIPSIDDKELVQHILGPSRKIKWIGKQPNGKYPDHNGWYSRELGGHQHTKIMLGNISNNLKEAKDLLRGGKGDYKSDQEFDADELKKGIKHEFEHTGNKRLAKEIAKDHLSEDPKYYSNLKKAGIEERLTKKRF